MTTDNTQELDDILFNLCDLSYASFTTQGEADRVADQLDYDRDEAKRAILNWHNKRIEEAVLKGRILEASEINSRYFENNDAVHDFLGERIRLNEAERNKLKESK